MTRYGSRKFILAFAWLVVNAWLLMEQAIDAGTYKALIIATVGVYIAGNVAQKVWSKDAAAQ